MQEKKKIMMKNCILRNSPLISINEPTIATKSNKVKRKLKIFDNHFSCDFLKSH